MIDRRYTVTGPSAVGQNTISTPTSNDEGQRLVTEELFKIATMGRRVTVWVFGSDTGYDVCGRLKSDVRLAQIPVLFLSALSEAEDKVKALQCGGVDLISKPFQFEEVRARVETHRKLYSLGWATWS